MDPHEIIAKLGMFWPMGDPGQLRQARAAYRQCASDIGTVQAACQSTGNQVQASNQGPPIDGFAAWLAKWQTDPGYFPAAISACNQLADACDAYAQKIEESHRRIIELAIAAGVALGVGLALTVFTFGGSDAAAGVTIAGLVAASLAEGTALSTAAAGIVVAIGVGAIEGMVFDGVIQVEAISFDGQKGFNWAEFGQSAGFGALTGGVGFGAGSLTTRVGSRLLPTLIDASPATARTLNALGRIPGRIRNGATGMVAGGGLAAGFDQLTTGHVNPQDVLIGTVGGGAGGAIGGGARGARGSSALTAEPTVATGNPELVPGSKWEPSAVEADLLARQPTITDALGSGQHDNPALTARFADGSRGIFKPVQGESHDWLGEIAPGQNATREVATFRTAHALGSDLVPTTTHFLDPVHGPGSLQEWVPNATRGHGDISRYTPSDQEEMAVLDYVTGNTDRYPPNYLTGPDGRLVAIDHGYTFPIENRGEPIRSDFVAAYLRLPLSGGAMQDVNSLHPVEFENMLRASGLSDPAIDGAVGRLRELQTNGMITGQAWGGEITDQHYTPVYSGEQP
jgi:hypothetical protein